MPKQVFDHTEAYILRRHPYRENHYLLDVLSKAHGRFRATARLAKQKTHRLTELLSPFHCLSITGEYKPPLSSLRESHILVPNALPPASLMSANYLNELIIIHLPADFPDEIIYAAYQKAIHSPTPQAIRSLEYTVLCQLYQIPEIVQCNHYYRIEQDAYGLRFSGHAKSGYPADLIDALLAGEDISAHSLSKHLLQTLLALHQQATTKTRTTTQALHKLLSS